MGRARNMQAAAGAMRRGAQRPGSPYVHDRQVSRAALDGRDGMSTGVWFHVTPAERAGAIRDHGLMLSGDVPDADQARWVDPDAIYVWPTERAARAWIAFRKDGFYAAGRTGSYTVLAVNARSDEVVICPDNEHFGGFLAAWSAARFSGEPWPTPEDSEEADFYQALLSVPGNGQTLAQWLDSNGQDVYFADDEQDEADDEDVNDERLIASRMVRALPPALRDGACRLYAKRGKPLMLTGVAVGASRVAEIVS